MNTKPETSEIPELTTPPVFIVRMEDELIHTDEHPFCSDDPCPCHDDADLVREYITQPLDNSTMTNTEAFRLYWNQTL